MNSHAHAFKATSHFLFNEVQCGCIYVEVFEPFGLKFCALGINMDLFAFFYMLVSRYIHFEGVFYIPLINFNFFFQKSVVYRCGDQYQGLYQKFIAP